MLLSNLNLLATAPGGVTRLRELILTLAVQGKLVPQDPADEPASVLLQKIRAEKDRLIAEGTIKKDKPLAAITEEEKPFELPQGWEWVRLADVVRVLNGRAYNKQELLEVGPVPVLRVGNLFTSNHWYYSDLKLEPEKCCEKGDLLYAWSASFGPFVWEGPKAIYHYHIWKLEPWSSKCFNTGFFHKFLAEKTAEIKAAGHGVSMVHMTKEKMQKIVVPLPPLAEQSRIVARVEELMRLCDALEAKGQLEATQHAQLLSTLLGTLTASATPEELADNWQRVAQHFDLLLDRPQAIDALEQTLLQLAVRGLLVPQDPADEPASVLLQKIRAEKDRLIAAGQIKKDKPLPPVTDEEKPFELPVGWEWSSLAAVGVISPRNYVADDTFASFVEMRSIPIAFGEAHISESRPWRDIKSGFTHFAEGDVGVAKITPCFENGKSTVFQNLSNGVGAGTTELHVIRPLCGLIPQYVLLFLKSPDFLNAGEVVMTGSAGQKRLPRAYFENTPFPLPPLAEQSRIVTRITQLRRLCADLRQRLAEREAVQARLAEALVQSVA